jgi:tRNA-modifying protein YgfZ
MEYIHNPHSILKITGPDRLRYLQGRVTQNLKNIDGNNAPWSLILSPQGKIEGVFYVLVTEDAYFLVLDTTDQNARDEFIKALFRFKVADQVFSEDVTENYQLYTLYQGDEVEDSLVSGLAGHAEYTARVKRGTLCCVDLFLKKDTSATFLKSALGFQQAELNDFERARILAGFPLSSKDIPASVFAPDLPVSRYVSFNKGCYAGQEVVEMATARGRPNRTLIQFRGQGILKFESGQILYVKKDTELKKAGFVTSIVSEKDSTKFVGLGYLKTVFLDEGSLKYYIGVSEDTALDVTVSPVT